MEHGSRGTLDAQDLIQDREVEDAGSDRLAHGHVADQLRDLVLSVPTPTNVAVWGPWGSGKSGVANLLRKQLQGQQGIKFVRFDAFKYAENPLRRNFISAVASALGNKDPRFREELYGGRVTAELKFGHRDMRRLLKTFAQMFGAVVLSFVVVMACLAWLRGGAYRPTFVDMATEALKAGIAPAALMTSLAVLVSRTLTREHKTEAADSDEQFEALFSDLIGGSKLNRLVVFVDELDRCAPPDVVATLDALRTFLGVDRCVFVVAADQQVLEEALTRALEQATPADTVNPYYSSGSGYLDKVFQYQISLPPLLVPKVTRYAADLVRERAGVWAQIDVNLIVSVLVPSHVRSPRRVKTLLNTFALTYRLAERRATDGLLETDPITRAEEIAKLVCLRVEFPLFARDLLIDPRLCEYVLALSVDSNAELDAHVHESVKQAALRYALLDAAVDHDLSTPADVDEEEPEADGVREHHGRQLLAYLKRTHTVSGPGRDLIYLETSGSIFGLSASLAETLEQQAQNADLEPLLVSISTLAPKERLAALALLLQQVRSAIGVEEENVVHAVLAVCGDKAIPLHDTADAAVQTLAPFLTTTPHELPRETLSGCWRLAQASDRPAALEMREVALRHSALEASPAQAAAMLADLQPALDANPDRVHSLVCQHLLSEDEAMADMLVTLPPEDASSVMTLISVEAAKQVQALIEAHKERSEAQATQSDGAPADDGSEPLSPSVVLERLSSLLQRWCPAAPAAAHAVVGLLLALEGREGQEIVVQHAAAIPSVKDANLARAVLSSTLQRPISEWPQWLGLLDAQLPVGDLNAQLESLLQDLWDAVRATDDLLDRSTVASAADGFMRLFSDRPRGEYPDITPFVLRYLAAPSNEEEAAEQLRLLTLLLPLESSSLLNRAALAEHQAAALADLFADAGEPSYSPDRKTMLEYITTVTGDCLRDLDSPLGEELSAEEARELVRALDSCGWLPRRDLIQLRVSARSLLVAGGVDPAGLEPLPTASAMATYATGGSSLAGTTLAGWITLEHPTGADLLSAVSAALRKPSALQTHSALLRAVASQLADLSAPDQVAFWRGLLSSPASRIPDRTLMEAGWPSLPDAQAAALLADRYAQTTKNPDRKAVLDLWKTASISSSAARVELVQRIIMPMLEAGQGAAESALAYLPQLMNSTPKAVRDPLRLAVADASSRWPSLEQRGIKALKAIGYTTERSGLLRRERISRYKND